MFIRPSFGYIQKLGGPGAQIYTNAQDISRKHNNCEVGIIKAGNCTVGVALVSLQMAKERGVPVEIIVKNPPKPTNPYSGPLKNINDVEKALSYNA